MFRTKFAEKVKTHISRTITFISKIVHLWDHVEKYCRPGQATDDSMAHTHCMLGTSGYKRTLRIRNIYRFSTATVVTRTQLDVTLHVHCMSC